MTERDRERRTVVSVLESLCESLEGGAHGVGVLEKEAVHDHDCLLPRVGARGAQKSEN